MGVMITHTVGALLAGGSSTRMGRDKAKLVVAGVTFLDRIHTTLCDVFTEVIVCGGSVVPTDGVLIADEKPGEGPLGGLLSALDTARGRPVFIVPVDVPMLTTSIVRSIAEPEAAGVAARIASVDGRDQPLVGVYGLDVAKLARSRLRSGRRSVSGLLDGIESVERVEFSSKELFNVNSRAQYNELIERYGV